MRIADLPQHDGPFATAYLTSRNDVPQAAQELATRWKPVRQSLAAQGATDALLDALDQAVRDTNHAAGDTLALVGADDEVLLHRHLPEPPAVDVGWVASLPRVAPLIEAEQTMLPHLVVLLDRIGADIYGFTASAHAVQHEVGDDDADDVTLAQGGGWSQRRYQQRAVNEWADNARDVAEDVVRLVKATDARLLAVGGDVRAVGFFKDALPTDVRELVHEVDGASRHPDGGTEHVAADVSRLVDTVVAAETAQVLAKFKEERGQGDLAADGPARVIEALQTASVQTLLVNDDLDDDRTAWFGPDPTLVGIDEASVRAMGVDEPWEARAVDVCIRAALGSGAAVRVVPKSVVTGNVGAILRFTPRP